MNTERIMGWTLRISAGVATSLLAAAVGLAIAGGGQSTGIAAQQSDSGGGRERSAPVVIRSLRENQTERSAVQFPVALEDMGNLEAEGAAAEEPVEDTTQILPHEDEMLLRTAMGEAEGESVEGKALVMRVILNRTESSLFPDSIEDVVFQRNQFSVTKPGGRYWTLEPDEGCYEALALVHSGWDQSEGALYFANDSGKAWFDRHCEYLFTVGGHNFYR